MALELTNIWGKSLDIIRENVNPETFKTWYSPIQPLKLENNDLFIQVPSMFFRDYFEEKHVELLWSALKHVAKNEISIHYSVVVDSTSDKNIQLGTSSPLQKTKTAQNSQQEINKFATPFERRAAMPTLDPQLNPKYTFGNFLEGKSNNLARTAGRAIAENPGKTAFNPLFIYGASGIGKTHLMNAIGLQALQNNTQLRVLYVSAQLFKVQYMDAIRNNRFNDFMNFYQTIDLLIVDDVQEFAGVTATQNTFFHIFNHLQQNNKQIILSSDKPPIQIQGLEDRLLTRFKWGLTAKMGRPDYELNRAIIEQKVKNDDLDFSPEVIDFIAKNVKDNVRDLEGIIVSLMAHSTFQNQEITIEFVRQELAKYIAVVEKAITIEEIQEVVCSKLKLEKKLLLTKSRKKEIVQARQISMFLSKKHTEYSLSRIGEILGNKDHATVLHACKTVKNQMDYDKSYLAIVQEIEATLQSN